MPMDTDHSLPEAQLASCPEPIPGAGFHHLAGFIHDHLSAIPAAACKAAQESPAFWRIARMTR